MLRTYRITLLLAFLLIFSYSWAQKESAEDARFKNAKELMNQEKFGLAMQALKPLTNSFEGNRYAILSSFYYAVAAYNDGQKSVAKDMFLQVLQKYPSWGKLDEVNLWLANIYLAEGDFNNGFTYASFIKNPSLKSKVEELKTTYLQQMTYDELDSLIKENPSDKSVAINIADKISALPIDKQDREYLENIVSVFDLDKEKYRIAEELKSIKKSKYNVAVLLPFMLDEISTNTKHLSNEFVIELYEGIMLGVSDLRNQGINISTHLYDTKKDSSTVSGILELPELKHMDLIIGPLYPDPVRVVSGFAYENQVNMVNPLSSNSKIIGNNPFAFLFKPSNETTARATADYLSSTLENKNAMIFHGANERDSSFAYNYKKEIVSRGFTVCYMEGIANEEGKKILDILTNTLTVEFDASEFDSLIVDDKVEGNLRITEKDYLVIQPDSIGHVFIASDNPSLIASTITGLETRGDAIALVGSERWLDHRVVSIGGLDRLNTLLISPTFISKSKPKLEGLNAIYMESFNAYPTRNFYIGYEVMSTFGKMMNKMGILFQFDPGINDYLSGELFSGALYGSANSNQIVPIVQFQNSELVEVYPR